MPDNYPDAEAAQVDPWLIAFAKGAIENNRYLQQFLVERDAEIRELRIQLGIAERRNADLANQLEERSRQLDGVLDNLGFDEKAVPA